MGQAPAKRMNVFERYLSLWVAACMALGVVIGKTLPGIVGAVRDLQFGEGSQINIPIAILIWLMIYPMMLKIDFASIRGVGASGQRVSSYVNWLVKPFSMAFLGWLFFKHLFLPLIGPQLASEYVAGVIAAVEGHGGRITMPKSGIPTVGNLVRFEDTEGNDVGAMKYETPPRQ